MSSGHCVILYRVKITDRLCCTFNMLHWHKCSLINDITFLFRGMLSWSKMGNRNRCTIFMKLAGTVNVMSHMLIRSQPITLQGEAHESFWKLILIIFHSKRFSNFVIHLYMYRIYRYLMLYLNAIYNCKILNVISRLLFVVKEKRKCTHTLKYAPSSINQHQRR